MDVGAAASGLRKLLARPSFFHGSEDCKSIDGGNRIYCLRPRRHRRSSFRLSSRCKAVVARHGRLGESGLADRINVERVTESAVEPTVWDCTRCPFRRPRTRIYGLTHAPFSRRPTPSFMSGRADRQGMCYTQIGRCEYQSAYMNDENYFRADGICPDERTTLLKGAHDEVVYRNGGDRFCYFMFCQYKRPMLNQMQLPRNFLGFISTEWIRGPRGQSCPSGAGGLWDAYVTWPNLEPARGKWDFSRLDKYVAIAEKRGVSILLPLGLTPAWASARPAEASNYKPGNAAEPSNLELWRNYVRTVASRYKGRIRTYELWNEPNIPKFFSGSVDMLVKLTQIAREELKKVDPNIQLGITRYEYGLQKPSRLFR